MSDETTTFVALAVVATALVVWNAKEGRAEDCGWEPDPDSQPAECTLNYNIWVDLTFPHQFYIDKFSLTVEETQLFEACIAAVYTTHDTRFSWAADVGRGEFTRNVVVPDQALAACGDYLNMTGL